MRLFDADIMMELVDRLPFRNNEDVKTFIEVQPTVDAEPIRHGRWKYEYSLGMNYCSECGWGMVKGERRHYNYCPNCGAKMDEVTE